MKGKRWRLSEAIAFYQSIGAPENEQALVELLHEVQREKGGDIPKKTLERIAGAYDVKKSFLREVVQKHPILQAAEAPHLLEMCGKPECMEEGSEQLSNFIERTYRVRNGGVSESGGFCYRIVHCLKKCGKGPVIRWDGKVYTHADPALIRALVNAGAEREPSGQPEESAAQLTGRRLIPLHGVVSVPPDVTAADFFEELNLFLLKRKWAYLDGTFEPEE